MAETTASNGGKAGRREWIGLAVLALPCVLYSMDLTVLNLAVPQLSADLKPSAAELLWIVDIYGFLVAGSLITMGTLGDRIGRRRLLLIGAGAFGLASVLAAFANSAATLIAARALLGVAGATLAPSTLSLIRNMFHDPEQRTFAIGVWVTSYSVGGAIGPLLGGVLLQWFWWGSVFLLAVPVMVLLLAVGPVLLPEYRDPQAGRIDLVSAALSLIAVLAVIYGLKQIARRRASAGCRSFSVVAGLAVGVAFVRRQRQAGRPADRSAAFPLARLQRGAGDQYPRRLRRLRNLPLHRAVPAAGARAVAAGGGSLDRPLVIGVHSGLDAGSAPRAAHPPAIRDGGWPVARRRRARNRRAGGGANGLPAVIGGFVVLSLGLSPVFILTTDLIVGAAPPERAGAAAAISETGSEFGGALGIAVLGSVVTAIYRGAMAEAVPPAVPAEAAQAAQNTLGGAVGVAAQLPGQVGAALLDAAREAFTMSLEVTAAICAVVAVAGAILAALMLGRGIGGSGGPEPGPKAAGASAQAD